MALHRTNTSMLTIYSTVIYHFLVKNSNLRYRLNNVVDETHLTIKPLAGTSRTALNLLIAILTCQVTGKSGTVCYSKKTSHEIKSERS